MVFAGKDDILSLLLFLMTKNRCKQLEMITFLENACDKINMRKKEMYYDCLLYTSDAADEEDSVEFGGRRIINKKK